MDVDSATYTKNQGVQIRYVDNWFSLRPTGFAGLEQFHLTHRIINRVCHIVSAYDQIPLNKEDATYMIDQILAKLKSWTVYGFDFIQYEEGCAIMAFKNCPICLTELGWDYYISLKHCQHGMHTECFKQMMIHRLDGITIHDDLSFRCPECRDENEIFIGDGASLYE